MAPVPSVYVSWAFLLSVFNKLQNKDVYVMFLILKILPGSGSFVERAERIRLMLIPEAPPG